MRRSPWAFFRVAMFSRCDDRNDPKLGGLGEGPCKQIHCVELMLLVDSRRAMRLPRPPLGYGYILDI